LLAQQANARGATQLNLPILAISLGESEANAVRYLTELEESRLIESSRGTVNKEDVRILFPRHPWLLGYTESLRDSLPSSLASAAKDPQRHLFAVESALTQAVTEGQAIADKKPGQSSRQRRRRRWFGRPRSRHSLETCLSFIAYQKEVLGRRSKQLTKSNLVKSADNENSN
jgi:hypothetical protein